MRREELVAVHLRGHVPARRMVAHRREHAVPVDLREQRRGQDRQDQVPAVLFFISGIAAAALQTATSPNSVVPSLGASGAIAGVLGAYLVMFPRRRGLSIVPLIFFF